MARTWLLGLEFLLARGAWPCDSAHAQMDMDEQRASGLLPSFRPRAHAPDLRSLATPSHSHSPVPAREFCLRACADDPALFKRQRLNRYSSPDPDPDPGPDPGVERAAPLLDPAAGRNRVSSRASKVAQAEKQVTTREYTSTEKHNRETSRLGKLSFSTCAGPLPRATERPSRAPSGAAAAAAAKRPRVERARSPNALLTECFLKVCVCVNSLQGCVLARCASGSERLLYAGVRMLA